MIAERKSQKYLTNWKYPALQANGPKTHYYSDILTVANKKSFH